MKRKKKKKNSDQKIPVEKIILITAILQLADAVLDLIDRLAG